MKVKVLSLLLALVMILGLVAACDGNATTTTTPGTTETTAGDSFASYTFAHNLWGSGAYPLEIIAKEAKTELAVFGCELDVADNQFTVDKVVTDLQAQLAKDVDGVQFFGVAPTMFASVAQLCNEAKTPFVLYDKIPQTEEIFAAVKNSEYFVGAISAEEYAAGVGMAEAALADGCSKAILVRAAVGDYSHDERERGFTETFVAGGGEVLGTTNCADPSEAVTKSNDLITAYPEADCLYGLGGDFVVGAINAIKSRNDDSSNLKLYATDISPDLAQALIDGELNGVNGGQWVAGAIANTLLINYLDGHPILDEDGNPPVFENLQMVNLAIEDAQAFIDMMKENKSPISDDEYKSLTYRYNPDVSYQTISDFLANYPDTFLAKIQ